MDADPIETAAYLKWAHLKVTLEGKQAVGMECLYCSEARRKFAPNMSAKKLQAAS